MKAEDVRTEHGVNHLAATLVVGLKLSQDYYRLLTTKFTSKITPELKKSSWQSFMGVRDLTWAEIEVLSDHKLLKSIFKKPFFKVPPGLQRIRLPLEKYNLKVR